MADLNNTIIRGNLRVTEEIIGPLNVTNLSVGANGQFLSISNNVPTWVNNPNTNTWRPIKLDGTVKLNQWTSGSELNIKAGNNMTITESNGTFTFAATDTNTDTKNTAGSTNSTSKLFLVGAASQAANPQTYSYSTVYETSGTLNATKFTVDAEHTGGTIQYNAANGCMEIIC